MIERTATKQRRGKPFQQGRSGNPNGRPKGARNKASLLLEKLFNENPEELGRACISLSGAICSYFGFIEKVTGRDAQIAAVLLPSVARAFYALTDADPESYNVDGVLLELASLGLDFSDKLEQKFLMIIPGEMSVEEFNLGIAFLRANAECGLLLAQAFAAARDRGENKNSPARASSPLCGRKPKF